MAELLVLARNSLAWDSLSVTDIEKALRGCYKKGDVVEVREDGAPYGSKECLPDFVIMKVSGVTKEQAIEYMHEWGREINFSILENNDPDYVVRITANIDSISQIDKVTKTQIKKYLEKQEADIVDHGDNYVDVEFTLGVDETFASLKQGVKEQLRTVKRRKWHFTETFVDIVIAGGGIANMTKSQCLSKIKNKWDSADGN